MNYLQQLSQWFKPELAAKGAAVLIAGYVVAKLLASLAERAARRHSDRHTGMMVGRAVYYAVAILVLVMVLDIFNVKLTAILAAAGIMSVALGFAAQASIANIISGLFLLIDKPFEIDDVIGVNQTTGTVTSIDLLSTKLRTFDNLYVRVPNETLVKATLTNFTRYQTRRLSLAFSIDHTADVAAAKQAMLAEAREYVHTITDPHPFVVVQGVDESGMKLELFLWVKGEAFLQAQSDLNEKINQALLNNNITLAFPRRDVINRQKIP